VATACASEYLGGFLAAAAANNSHVTAAPAAGPAAATTWASYEQQAMRLTRKLARGQLGLFAPYPDCGTDDLAQEALAAVHKAFPRFNPTIAAFSTFATKVGHRAILNMHRGRKRDADRQERKRADVVEAVEPDHVQWEPDEAPGETIDGEVVGSSSIADEGLPPLAEWLACMFAHLQRNAEQLPADWNRGRTSFTAVQQLAAGLLMRRLRLTCRAAAGLFQDRPDLRAAIAMVDGDVPAKDWFARAAEMQCEYFASLPPRKRPLLAQLVDLPPAAAANSPA
jgi:RNA polymerase sigma factor (sigma-70 family)